jgi:ubiquitin-conjugating enzyme E2 T
MMSSTTSIPIPAKMRVTRELSLLSTSPPPGISCYTPNDTLTHLHAHISGPPDSPFEDGCFLLVIHIPMRYPFEPPRVRFLTPIHHPNIDSQGRICLDSLKSQPTGSWSPAISLPSLLLQIRALMGEPNAEDGLVAEVTEQYKKNFDSWHNDAKKLTLKEATDDKLISLEQGYLKSILAKNTETKRKASPKISTRKIEKENKIQNETTTMTLSGTKRKESTIEDSKVSNKIPQNDER